jgi:hypothetical protein
MNLGKLNELKKKSANRAVVKRPDSPGKQSVRELAVERSRQSNLGLNLFSIL